MATPTRSITSTTVPPTTSPASVSPGSLKSLRPQSFAVPTVSPTSLKARHRQSSHSESSLRDSAQRHLRWRYTGAPNHNARSGLLQLPRFRLHYRDRHRPVAALLFRSWYPRLRSEQHSSRSLAAIQPDCAASTRQLLYLPDQLRRSEDRSSDDDRSHQSKSSRGERHHRR